jgi:hypothetical protein
VSSVLFYISFFKLRIVDFYYKVLYNHSSFEIIISKYSTSNYYLSGLLLISCYGLYILNLYWFLIINKIVFKSITKVININNDTICHMLCRYSQWVNIPVSFYIYSKNPNERNIFDMIGILALTFNLQTNYWSGDLYYFIIIYGNKIILKFMRIPKRT